MTPVLLRYDLRSAPGIGTPTASLYAAALDQVAWADGVTGMTGVVLSEHHGVDDGYSPSPLVVAAAVAAVTRRLMLLIGALVLPLHDPLRIAEDLAVLDLISGGRTMPVFVAGYRGEEFAMFGRSMAGRGQALERSVTTIRAAWRGEQVPGGDGPVKVTPLPATPGGPTVLLGGSSPASARRAARLADGFMPAVGDAEVLAAYHDERTKLGLGPGIVSRADGPMGVFVSDDPDATWERLAPFAWHEANSYGAWAAARPGASPYRPFADTYTLRRDGPYRVVTPEECVAYVRGLPEGGGLLLHPLLGGVDPEVGWESLRLVADRVLPQLEGGRP